MQIIKFDVNQKPNYGIPFSSFLKTLLILTSLSLSYSSFSQSPACCGCFDFATFNTDCIANFNDCANCNDAACMTAFGIDHINNFCNGNASCVGEGCAVTLPVELTEFNAEFLPQRGVSLSWKTGSEINNEGFEVQRSSNAQVWESIEFVRGAGTSYEAQYYEILDDPKEGGLYYYRLMQVDYNSATDYSKSIAVLVTYEERDGIILYPNPVIDALVIRSLEEKGEVTIYNAIGQAVENSPIEGIVTQIDVRNLRPGQYAVEVRLNSGKKYTKMIVK